MDHKTFKAALTGFDDAQGIVKAIFSVTGNIDHGQDRIKAGAFTKTISERGLKVLVLDNHDTSTVNSAIAKTVALREVSRIDLPIKTLQSYPDATGGVEITAQFMLDDPRSAAAFKRIKNGLIDEWSFGYDAFDITMEQEQQDGRDIVVRNIGSIKLYEVSPVLFGMNEATSTVDAKSADTASGKPAPMVVSIKDRNLMEQVEDVSRSFYAQYPDSNEIVYWVKQVWDNFIIVEQKGIFNKMWQINYVMGESAPAFDLPDAWQEVEIVFAPANADKGDDDDQEQKAGRAISARNEARMRSIIDSVQAQLAQLEAILPSAAMEEEQEPEESARNDKTFATKRELGQYVLETFNRMIEVPFVKNGGYENTPGGMRKAIAEEYGLETQREETTQHEQKAGPGDTPPTVNDSPLVDIDFDTLLNTPFEEVQ